MINKEKMQNEVSKYQLWFDEDDKEVYLIKRKGEVKISIQRAIDWINVGISDLDCRNKEEMIKLLNSWMEEIKK